MPPSSGCCDLAIDSMLDGWSPVGPRSLAKLYLDRLVISVYIAHTPGIPRGYNLRRRFKRGTVERRGWTKYSIYKGSQLNCIAVSIRRLSHQLAVTALPDEKQHSCIQL